MANRVRSILDRLRTQNLLRQRQTQRNQILGLNEIQGVGGSQINLNRVPETQQAADVLQQISGIDRRLASLPGLSLPFGEGFGVGGFVTDRPGVQRAFQNRAGGVTDILQQLKGGVDPESLGLFRRSDIAQQRSSLQEERNRALLGPQQTEVETPLQRLGQALLGLQASRGLAQGGSAQSFLGAEAPEQIQALTVAGIGGLRRFGEQPQPGILPALAQRSFDRPGAPGISSLLDQRGLAGMLGQIQGASQAQNRFNVFNPPPFFSFL